MLRDMMDDSNMGRVSEGMNIQAEDIASAYAARVFEHVGDAVSWALGSQQDRYDGSEAASGCLESSPQQSA